MIGPRGNGVDTLVIDDGRPGVSNCSVDAGEAVLGVEFEDGVVWGTAKAGAKVSSDSGGGGEASGSTFLDTGGNPARWVLFLPEGVPLAFDSGCVTGEFGTGAGGLYLNDGAKDSAVVLTPLGGRQTYAWDAVRGQWRS